MLLVIVTLLFLANTLSTAEFKSGDGLFDLLDTLFALFADRGAPTPLIFPPAIWNVFFVTFWLIVILAFLFTLVNREGRREIPRLVKLLLKGFLIAWAITLLFRLGVPSEEIEELDEPTGSEPADLPYDNFEAERLADPEEALLIDLLEYPTPNPNIALIVVGILFAFALLLLLLRWWRYQKMLKEIDEMPLDELRVRAIMALEELRQGKMPLSDVIRRCYREMMQTVREQRGVYRERNVTPREFEKRLQQIGLPQPPVQRLTRLFEQVRYGNAPTSEREKREAIDSLKRIVDACEQHMR
ncbi:MAG: DUF4129 domain-containing protein [Chloroflexi bacterium]|nr:DUF4129 domain-containing protein [Chloroflexota bacterium]